MYSIEYYRRGKNEPEWISEEIHEEDFETKEAYLEQVKSAKISKACWNIKSLTIDVEDLSLLSSTLDPYNAYCDAYDLDVFCNCAKRLKAKKITVENKDYYINRELIYTIINTKWLINEDNFEYTDDYDEDEAFKEVVGKMHQILTKLETSTGYETKWDCELSDCLKQLRHYCYESEKFSRDGIEELQEGPKKIGQKQLDIFFERYDY